MTPDTDVNRTGPLEPGNPTGSTTEHTELTGRTATGLDTVAGTAPAADKPIVQPAKEEQKEPRDTFEILNPKRSDESKHAVRRAGQFLIFPKNAINFAMISNIRQEGDALRITSIAGDVTVTNKDDIAEILDVLGM